jgi:hypothetical protein
MSADVVQQDFGGFDPRFPGGIGITLGSVEAYRAFARFAESDADSASASTGLGEIALKSVIDHEVRHFHDALLSPWANSIFRMRAQALMNGMQAIRVSRDVAGDTLPLPVGDWLRLNEEERSGYVREWEELVGAPVSPVPLPCGIDVDAIWRLSGSTIDTAGLEVESEFLAFTSATLAAYDLIRKLLAGDPPAGAGPELRPSMIFEVTALAVQLVGIWQSQGSDEVLEFLSHLIDSERPYAKLWTLFTNLALELERAAEPDASYLSLVLAAQRHVLRMGIWTLLGNQELDGMAACPTRRFVALAEHLLAHLAAPENRAMDAAEAWDWWDAGTGSRPWRVGCQQSLDASQTTLRRYEDLAATDRDGPALLLSNVLGRRVADQKAITLRLFRDANSLADVAAYVSAAPGVYPVPCLRIDLDGFAIPAPETDPPGYRAVRVTAQDGGALLTNRFAMSIDGVAGGESLDDLLAFESAMCVCDLAFARHRMPWQTSERSRDVIRSVSRKRVLLIV